MYFPSLILISLLTATVSGPGAIAAPAPGTTRQRDVHAEDCPEAAESPLRLLCHVSPEVARKIRDSRREPGNVNQGILFDGGLGNATAVSDTAVTLFPTPSSPSPPDQTAPIANLTTAPLPGSPITDSQTGAIPTKSIPLSTPNIPLSVPTPNPLPSSGFSTSRLNATSSSQNLNLTITITGPTLTVSTITLPTPTSTSTVFVTAPPITISPTGVVNGSYISPSLSIVTVITVTAWPVAPPATTIVGTVEPLVGETVTIVETTAYTTTSAGIVGAGTKTWTSVVVIPASVTKIEGSSVTGTATAMALTTTLATATGTGGGTTFEIVFVTLPAPAPSVVTVYQGTTTVTVS
ncbi:hypothetical protein OQA88_3994 [Cercophora sp. LCS_1]